MKDITPRDDELAFARQAERIGVTRADGFQLERLDVAAVVLTPWPREPSTIERSNRDTIARLGEVQALFPNASLVHGMGQTESGGTLVTLPGELAMDRAGHHAH